MFSVNEILQSKEFEKEAPKGFKFHIRKVRRENERQKHQQTKNSVSIEKSKIRLAK